MPSLETIKRKIRIAFLIEKISSAYQEISQKEMKNIREMTIKNREFIEKLIETYSELKKASFAEDLEGEKEKKEMAISPQKRKKEKAIVFLSANARFYGGLILEIWQKIKNLLEKEKSDLIIIGRAGKNLVEKTNPDLKFFYFEIDDEKPKDEGVEKVVSFLKNYEEIIFVHGKFKTILTQQIAETIISGKIPEKEIKKISAFLFEPSKEAVLDFFENELIKSFFLQIFLEHRLSRHATRMVQMYRVKEKARKRRQELEDLEKKFKWELFNKKQTEITTSSKLWR